MAQQPMYSGQVNSPETELSAAIDGVVTTISLLNAAALPAAPNIAVIGEGDIAETILYTGKSGNNLTGVTRGFQGVASSWGANSKVARHFTAYDYDTLRANIVDHETRLAPLTSPAFTGTPTAPTAATATNNTLIATTALVQAKIDLAIANLIDSAPGALDTLNELAAAMGDDPNFAATVTNAIALKLNSSAYTAADVLAKLLTVDGTGSGLDAEMVGGHHITTSSSAPSGGVNGDIWIQF
ncbi:hypothetical protein [Cohnella lupini]|uniref:Uncharacterized protein n=1 Tax=Cohnella lupini TaxID=1294267 RepID=A0A3D9HZD4_9BACL|nr:hypothetical protein [Cohnella lupini]RED54805.1 hypothetical protein DFP95_12161 [Cohnella lupini]